LKEAIMKKGKLNDRLKLTRRQFLKSAAVTGIGMALPLKFGVRSAHAFAQSPGLTKFADPMPQFGAQIPLAASDGTRTWGTVTATHYSIDIGQFKQLVHSDFITPGKPAFISTTFSGTNFRGYGQAGNFAHLGTAIIANRSEAVQITFTNKLTGIKGPIPVDISLPGPNQNNNRAAVHLHGGFIPWISDGGPHDWFDPTGGSGLSFPNNQVLNPAAMAGQAEYYYPNDQSARLMWYHDHAWGITRTNAYAGIASGYLITDAVEQSLIGVTDNGGSYFGLLGGLGEGTPLVIQDKIFVPQNINIIDPTWLSVVDDPGPGNLWYAHVYDPTRWRLYKGGKGTLPPPDPSNIPEFFGDTMLMNGHVSPFMEVPPKRVRFRLLNACNARFVNLQLFMDDGSADGITLNPKTLIPTNPPGPPMVQIGTEAGFLPAPVVFTPPTTPFNPVTFNGTMLLGPAERADFIIDFNGLPNGAKIILYTDAPAPFPVGDPRNDYFPGAPKNPTITTPGMTPNTRQIMQFKVNTALGTADATGFTTFVAHLNAQWTSVFNDSHPGEPLLAPIITAPAVPTVPAPTRTLTLNEDFDQYGRLIQRIGTNVPLYKGTFARNYMDTPTENVVSGATEVWQIANLTGDTHPIHFHLVNFQIIARQPFNVKNFAGVPAVTGPARGPDPNEAGWKETIRMNPGEVITVIAKFTLPTVPFTVPASPRTGGNEYAYHCHILDHEEHDMMRPLVVT
jgi:spore coat protein A, manganese oxidase